MVRYLITVHLAYLVRPASHKISKINAEEGVEGREPPCTVAGSGKRSTHEGAEYVGPSENKTEKHLRTRSPRPRAQSQRSPRVSKT